MFSSKMTRRQFVINGMVAAGGAALYTFRKPEPANPLRVGIIGLGKRGNFRLAECAGMSGVEVRSLCDRDDNAMRRGVACLKAYQKSPPSLETDYGRLVDRSDLDVVAVATPVSMRAEMTLRALAAGKHVYVEPPWADNIEASRSLLEAGLSAEKLVWQGSYDSAWDGNQISDFIGSPVGYDRIEIGVFRGDRAGWKAATDSLDLAYAFLGGVRPIRVSAVRGLSPAPNQAAARYDFEGRNQFPSLLALQSLAIPGWNEDRAIVRVIFGSKTHRVEHHIQAVEAPDIAGSSSFESFLERLTLGSDASALRRAHFTTSCFWQADAAMRSGEPLRPHA